MSETDYRLGEEPGLLWRVRSVRDLLPAAALGDALRPATSLIGLALSAAALWITEVLHWWLATLVRWLRTGNLAVQGAPSLPDLRVVQEGWFGELPPGNFPAAALYFGEPLWWALSSPGQPTILLHFLLQLLVTWLVWFVPAAYVMRATVLTVAGKTPMGTAATLRLAVARTGAMLGGPSLILFAVLLIAAVYLVIGICGRVPVLGDVLGWLALPLALVGGVLGVGLIAGIGLMWAAAVVEEFADAFDVVSRSFEYLLQRPLRTAWYAFLATLISIVMLFVASWILAVAERVSYGMARAAEGSGRGPAGLVTFFSTLYLAYALNLFFGLMAVIYLLLRRDANHQELHDVWEPPPAAVAPLPQLRLDEQGVPVAPAAEDPAT